MTDETLINLFNEYDKRVESQFQFLREEIRESFKLQTEHFLKGLNDLRDSHQKEIQSLIMDNLNLKQKMDSLDSKINNLKENVDQGFVDAGQNFQRIIATNFNRLEFKLEQFQRTYKDFTQGDDKSYKAN